MITHAQQLAKEIRQSIAETNVYSILTMLADELIHGYITEKEHEKLVDYTGDLFWKMKKVKH